MRDRHVRYPRSSSRYARSNLCFTMVKLNTSKDICRHASLEISRWHSTSSAVASAQRLAIDKHLTSLGGRQDQIFSAIRRNEYIQSESTFCLQFTTRFLIQQPRRPFSHGLSTQISFNIFDVCSEFLVFRSLLIRQYSRLKVSVRIWSVEDHSDLF
jgi:hypothetical protein